MNAKDQDESTGVPPEVEEWLQRRKEAAKLIDPETAETMWRHAEAFDPYGIGLPIPQGCQCVGRESSARSPGSDIWVWFGDLPEKVAKKLWERDRDRLAFPSFEIPHLSPEDVKTFPPGVLEVLRNLKTI